jgi:hypothetical protein
MRTTAAVAACSSTINTCCSAAHLTVTAVTASLVTVTLATVTAALPLLQLVSSQEHRTV